MEKTNAMRFLDSRGIEYEALGYEVDDGRLDGISVSDKIARPYESVFKTLVTKGQDEVYIFLLPVAEELDLKKAARHLGEKKLEMVGAKDLYELTGYVRGGCSPLAMKKYYRTIIDQSAEKVDQLVISGGKIGSQIEISLENLGQAMDLELAEIIK